MELLYHTYEESEMDHMEVRSSESGKIEIGIGKVSGLGKREITFLTFTSKWGMKIDFVNLELYC